MGIVVKLPPETIGGLFEAAQARFAEGTRLMEAGHFSGSIYLFGYVAEMILKGVGFRHFGYGQHVQIRRSDRAAIEDLMKQEALAPRGQHDILKWAKWIVLKKAALTGAPYSQAFSLELERNADHLDYWWSPSLRYHRITVSFFDVLSVQMSASWILAEEPNL